MCCKSEQSNNCFDKIFLVRIWKFTPVLVWLKALVRIHNLIQECLMFWFFWSDETHGDAEILGMQIWNFRYANMDFYKTSHIQIWFLGKDPVFEYEFLVLFSLPPVRITWKVLCTWLVWFCHHKMVMMLHFVRLEACPLGGLSAWRPVLLEACPPGGAELESCPPGGLQLEGCPTGGTC